VEKHLESVGKASKIPEAVDEKIQILAVDFMAFLNPFIENWGHRNPRVTSNGYSLV